MTYTADYISAFRDFAAAGFAERQEQGGKVGPIDVHISIEDGMYATQRRDETNTRILADPPYFGEVTRLVDGLPVLHELSENPARYAEQCAAACKWAEDSPEDRTVQGVVLNFSEGYRSPSPVRCSDCGVTRWGQHKPSCHRAGMVTASSDYRRGMDPGTKVLGLNSH